MASLKADQESYPRTLWVSVTGALLGSLQFGYQIGILNTAQPYVVKELHYHNEAVLSSAIVLGAAFGAITAGQIADGVGPRKAQLLNVIPFVLGVLLTAVAPVGYWGFLLGRLISGFGAGAASLYAPRYIAEISPVVYRGRLGSQHQVFINLGILAAYLVGIPYEHDFTGFHMFHFISWWRVMIGIGIAPAVIQVAILLFCPESPLWLEGHGDEDKADEACIRLWGAHAIVPDQISEAPLLDGHVEDEEERQAQEGWSALLKPQYRLMLALGLGLPVLQQASGINTVIYYSSEVFQRAGLQSPILGSILMGLVNVAFTLVAASLMDKMGRKPLLQLSFLGMALSLMGVAVTIYVPTGEALQGALTVSLIILYVLCFAMGAGPIPWIYISEIMPLRIKGPAAALGTCLSWLGNLGVTLTFTHMLHAFGIGGSYLLYAALNLAALAYVTKYMVETKCCSMGEIEKLLLLPEDGPQGYSGLPSPPAVD